MSEGLLPAGFHDLVFPEAGIQEDIVYKISKFFEGYGYAKVLPPVMEFEETLLTGAGNSLANKTFRVMDPVSHEMMGVRTDITVQVARIAKTRLKDIPLPIRLSYSGDVFRVKGEGLYAERQFTQAGIELVGVDSAQADAEIIIVTLGALSKLGIKDLCVDFTVPGFVEEVLKEIKLSDEEKQNLMASVKRKDVAAITKIAKGKADILIDLAQPSVGIETLKKIKLPKNTKNMVEKLREVISLVEHEFRGAHISIDLLESVKFEYHSGIGFSIFSKKAKEELGRGGRYFIDSKITGVGATLYVNELFRIMKKPEQKEKVFVPLGSSINRVSDLREEGFITIWALEDYKDCKKEAIRLGCKYVLEGGRLISL